MKKMTKLMISLAASLFFVGNAVALTACESEDSVSGITTGDVPVVAYDGSEVTISFYHCMGAALKDILADGIDDFTKMYPNIKVLNTSFGDYDGVRNQISTELGARQAPSLAYCYPDHVALYNKTSAVLPLDQWIASTAKASGSNEQMGLTQAQIDDYVPMYWNEGKIYDDAGTMYTLPMLKSTELLYYNKTYFTENNLTVPTTWDEMEATCQQILDIEAAKEGGSKANPCIPLGYDSSSNWFITMTEQLGTDYTTSEKGNYFTFNTAENRAFVEKFRGWYDKQYVTTEPIFGSYTSDLFTETAAGKTKAYMCIGSSAGAGYQTPDLMNDGKTYPFEVGVAMIPQTDTIENLAAAGKTPKMLSQGPSICLFKKQNSQEVAAAWLFAKFITTNVKFQAKCSMNNGYTPAIQSVAENTTYSTFLAKSENGNAYLQAAAVKLTMQMQDYYYVSPAFPGSSAAREEMESLMTNCFKQKPEAGQTVSQLIEALFTKSYNTLKRKYDK